MEGHTKAAVPKDDSLTLKREFSFWSTFALAFAFISPIVALYAIFAFASAAGGPAMWWGFSIVLAGQLLVALVFAELASKWPFEGSVYQWARRLRNETYGWFTGWAYMWTLAIAIAAVAYGAAGFVPIVLDIDPFTPGTQLVVAIALIAFVTVVNTAGRRWMKIFVAASICAEVIGSLGIGTVLLFFHHENVSSLFEARARPTAPGHTSGAGCSPPWRSSAGRSWASRAPRRSPGGRGAARECRGRSFSPSSSSQRGDVTPRSP